MGIPFGLRRSSATLLNNAIKFTDPRRTRHGPRRALNHETRLVTIEVRDTGIGMTPHTIASLFEPFAQAQETLERSSGGLGLGLAVVKGLIELHAGSIEATSPGPGQGATFTIHLPLWRGPQLHEPSPNEDAPEADPLRVLVVDDNRDVLHLLSKLLKLRGPYRGRGQRPDRKGSKWAREFRPDLVLCDIGLPGEMNGVQGRPRCCVPIPPRDARG